MKQFINEKVVSEITGLKLPTLRNHRFLCKGLPYVKIGRSIRYDPADVYAYMEKHRIDPEAGADR